MCEIMEEYGAIREARGEARGEEKGKLKSVVSLLKKGIITEKEATDEIGMTVDDFKKAMGAVS
ncbi:hypothetical protein NZ47_11120 [Anaerovibrio lipolyticus]|uniref:Transposase n=2 Tax=Anaerovibrio lipolyticus TaxID=82374 RepID=A0A0B2JX78_9FIRM|nr:hypothetical protein NZ47_11120 [Anaerovibrio lipolyticus]